MATIIWNGHREQTILNARERVYGTRGNWAIRRDVVGDFAGFSTKREALEVAANIARAARRSARRMAAAVARVDQLPTAERAALLVRCADESIALPDLLDQLDAAGMAAAECASCGATDTPRTLRHGDAVCIDADACVDRRNAQIIDQAHAEALLEDMLRMEYLQQSAQIEDAERAAADPRDLQSILGVVYVAGRPVRATLTRDGRIRADGADGEITGAEFIASGTTLEEAHADALDQVDADAAARRRANVAVAGYVTVGGSETRHAVLYADGRVNYLTLTHPAGRWVAAAADHVVDSFEVEPVEIEVAHAAALRIERDRRREQTIDADQATHQHRAHPRPASSRFVDDDARNGLEAFCWECGDRIVSNANDSTWRHAPLVRVGDVVQLGDALGHVLATIGHALGVDLRAGEVHVRWAGNLEQVIDAARLTVVPEDVPPAAARVWLGAETEETHRAAVRDAAHAEALMIDRDAGVAAARDAEQGSVTITVGGNDRAGIPAVRYPSGAVHRVQGGEITHRVTKSTAATFQPDADAHQAGCLAVLRPLVNGHATRCTCGAR